MRRHLTLIMMAGLLVSAMLACAGPAFAWSGYVRLDVGAAWTRQNSVGIEYEASSSAGSVVAWRYRITGQSSMSSWYTFLMDDVFLGSNNGMRTVYMEFKDPSGDVSPTYSDSIFLDTKRPWTRIRNTESTIKVKRYAYVTLKYSVQDATKRANAWEQPILRIKNSGGKIVYERVRSWRHPNGHYYVYIGGSKILQLYYSTWKFQVKLPKGTYKLILTARDKAGNWPYSGLDARKRLVVY